jgi:hypothetical protein
VVTTGEEPVPPLSPAEPSFPPTEPLLLSAAKIVVTDTLKSITRSYNEATTVRNVFFIFLPYLSKRKLHIYNNIKVIIASAPKKVNKSGRK